MLMGSKSLGEGGWKKDTWMEDNNETQLPSAGERKAHSVQPPNRIHSLIVNSPPSDSWDPPRNNLSVILSR